LTYNQYNLGRVAQRLTTILKKLFSELPEVEAIVEKDAEAIVQSEASRAQWAQRISFKKELGLISKSEFSISEHGVSWKGTNYPLESIVRLRWGATRHSINGIPTGTTYSVVYGDDTSLRFLSPKLHSSFQEITSALWNAVGFMLITKLLESLRADGEHRFGDIIVRDVGVTLTTHKLISSTSQDYTWDKARIWSANGSFVIGVDGNKSTYGKSSYMSDDNTHVLEAAIRAAFKVPGLRRLSEMLKN
ncbi:MAG: hypothetical protein ACRECH_18780, partial [Nitrososphaerales archaeon]